MALRGSLLNLLRTQLKHNRCQQQRAQQSLAIPFSEGQRGRVVEHGTGTIRHVSGLSDPQFRTEAQSVAIIGAPFSKGQRRAGVEHGPKAIRDAGLIERLSALGHRVHDFGDEPLPLPPERDEAFMGASFPRTVGLANRHLSGAVSRAVAAGHACVVLGGDHSMSVGSVAGHARHRPDLCVVWVDAHADVNTPATSPSGNLHGQSVAFLLGELRDQTRHVPGFEFVEPWRRLSAEDLVYVGLRDLDPGERAVLEDLGVRHFTMRDVDRVGVPRVMEMALDRLLSRNARRPIHLSFDIDAFDPRLAPATGTPVSGGLSYREGVYIAEEIHRTGLLSVMDLMEVNPALGGAAGPGAGEETAKLAVDVIAAAFGQTRGR